MLNFIFFTVLTSVVLVALALSMPQGLRSIEGRLPKMSARAKKSMLRSLLAPFSVISRPIVEHLKIDEKLKNNLGAARIYLSSAEFFSIKLIMTAIGTLLAVGIMKGFNIQALAIGLVIGYVLPDIWLQRKIRERKNAIARILPETVDLLGLCIEAGLDFSMAIKWVLSKAKPNPMLEELAFILEEIRWGKPRTQALKDMAKRLNISEVSSFVQTLVLAERMGTPVSEAFTILSEDVRLQRFRRGERIAMQAPIKILIPLIFCILPVIGIVIGGPILLQFMQGGLAGR